jgi:hypothetical protein
LARVSWKRRVGIVFAAAAAGVLLTAGTAHANATVWVLDSSGFANWTENGDTLTVCDQSPDGWGVRGYIYRPYVGDVGNGTVLMKASDPQYDVDCAYVSVDIPESVSIYIKVCNYKGASIIYCQWTNARP